MMILRALMPCQLRRQLLLLHIASTVRHRRPSRRTPAGASKAREIEADFIPPCCASRSFSLPLVFLVQESCDAFYINPCTLPPQGSHTCSHEESVFPALVWVC